jgi:DNA helicase-2/ATP-dependent DNA helicase PcrA
MNPTQQQELIINSTGDIVIIANPGSGKTFVVSEKIKRILPLLPDHKGVVAISYTNKASQELKNRCLKNGLDPKSSFFGTIDRFYVSEIIVPFAKHLFGLPKDVIKIVKRNDLSPEKKDSLNWLDSEFDYQNLPAEHIQYLKNEFLEGNIVLESIGIFAIYVFDKSIACKNYLKSRYATIVIDEYQDSGREQHAIFLRIRSLGIEAIAVGDANQSIFKFSGKSSEFLLNLAKEENNFALYPLDYNHRCHPSITNYSLRLLNKDAVLLETEEINVFEKKVTGNEADIAIWIKEAIPKFCKKYGVTDLNAVYPPDQLHLAKPTCIADFCGKITT